MNSNVRVTVDKTADLMRAIKALTKNDVLVGVPAETAMREPEPGEENPPNNAVLGYIHEFGAPEKNIPARPFLVPGVASKQDEYAKLLKKAAQDALSGNLQPVEKAQNAVGLIAQNAVRQKITDGPFAPLSPVTIERRRAKGNVSTTPLVDTGTLRRAVTYVIREHGK